MTPRSAATTGNASFTSMRFIRFKNGREVPLLQGEDIRLRLLPQAAPDDRASLLMHLQHLLPGRLLIEAEDLFEHHHHVGHEVDRIVEDDNTPYSLQRELGPGLLLRQGA